MTYPSCLSLPHLLKARLARAAELVDARERLTRIKQTDQAHERALVDLGRAEVRLLEAEEAERDFARGER